MREKVKARLYCLYEEQKIKLEKLAKHHEMSQSAILRRLVEEAYDQDIAENKN